MCRYNFSIANKSISEEFGFSRAEMGYIITTALFAYACGQIINGLLTDRIGGKRAMLIGAAGTIVMNILFRRRVLRGDARPVHRHSRHGRLPAGVRRARHGQDQHRLVQPPRARTVLRHLRLHDQPRALRHFHSRPGAAGRLHRPRPDPHSAAALALAVLDAVADLRRGGGGHGADGQGNTRGSRLPRRHPGRHRAGGSRSDGALRPGDSRHR